MAKTPNHCRHGDCNLNKVVIYSGKGIDDDGNGLKDCEDDACSDKDECSIHTSSSSKDSDCSAMPSSSSKSPLSAIILALCSLGFFIRRRKINKES